MCEQILKTSPEDSGIELKFDLHPCKPLSDEALNFIISFNLKQQSEEAKSKVYYTLSANF